MEEEKESQEDESEKDESELEQEIEEEEKEKKIDTKKLQKFIQQKDFFPEQEIEIEDSTPSLERRDISQGIPVRLEQGIADSKTVKEDEENNSFNYSSKIAQKDEPNYHLRDDETFIPKQTDMGSLGRTDFQQQVGFVNARENIDSINPEKYDIVREQDILNLGRNENPFATKQIKYEPSEK